MEMRSFMMEISSKKAVCQNQLLFTSYRSKTNLAVTCFRSLLPTQIADFCRINFLKNLKFTDKLLVRKLRTFYLLSRGDKEK
jgi:hypothetical protein